MCKKRHLQRDNVYFAIKPVVSITTPSNRIPIASLTQSIENDLMTQNIKVPFWKWKKVKLFSNHVCVISANDSGEK